MSTNQHDEIGLIGYVLGGVFLILLIIAGIISYRSIDWNVLKKIESQKLMLPPPATNSAQLQPKVSTPSNAIKK